MSDKSQEASKDCSRCDGGRLLVPTGICLECNGLNLVK